ncbi:Integral membrane protein YggT, involved in response to extracytoplasmic stress (osmotic shock) [Marinobacterium lacunae]|uniref:Integral membrane protein YggT, involved in response to extracytoplasmic stress (Osmotic shock) n=1 Tax=Marinobacterium lacunae TaxID=1232683 RepID=A0A081G334_9GAMM|nr:YggT family protein [Marinobacterium lacunae]KEA65189.1 Integral membrane protein YggT, involved in response to extracytoplasmic stress (osmotic shock) [Marinobacterium lacunae]MBR9885528.1 YggT family protein [Oceanospirillales bacterium]
MAQDPIILIIHTVGQIYAFILILRFLLQVAGADYYNPISQAVVRATSVPLKPLQKLLPRAGRIDLSPLLLAYGVYILVLLAIMLVRSVDPNIPAILLFSAATLLDSILLIYFWAVIGAVIISWIAPDSYHPAPQLLLQITEPLFRLSRKVIPSLGGLDLSPILIFLIIQIVRSQLAPFTF